MLFLDAKEPFLIATDFKIQPPQTALEDGEAENVECDVSEMFLLQVKSGLRKIPAGRNTESAGENMKT